MGVEGLLWLEMATECPVKSMSPLNRIYLTHDTNQIERLGPFRSQVGLDVLKDVGKVTTSLGLSPSCFKRTGFSLLSLSALAFRNSRLNVIHNHPTIITAFYALDDI